jgi:hypothetical protein
MEHYSFQGPYAYRWLDDVPVERIDLRSGERRCVRIGSRPALPPVPGGGRPPCDSDPQAWRSRMAAWN